MIEILELFFFGADVPGLQKAIAPFLAVGLLAAGGFASGGGLGGIIGGGKRRREEGDAKREQRQAENAYFNFDFNQEVGGIKNIYSDQLQRQQSYLQRQQNQLGSNQLRAAQQQEGGFAASQNLLFQQNELNQQNALALGQVRQQGLNFVEQERRRRVNFKYDQAGERLARSEYDLTAAKQARIKAREAIYRGIGGAVASGVGASAGVVPGEGGGKATFNWQKGLEGSGLLPSHLFNKDD